MTGLHSDALASLRGWVAPSPAQEALRQAYVAHLVAHPDGLDRSCLPDHVTASVLVLDAAGGSVLLTLHTKARQWFQLGGHTERGDTTLAGAALREATEESGIPDLALDPVPVQLDTHEVPFCGGRPDTRHLDVRFVAMAPPGARAEISAESAELRWWPADDLPSDEPSLRELVHLGRHRTGDL